jgi:hypothetical protein
MFPVLQDIKIHFYYLIACHGCPQAMWLPHVPCSPRSNYFFPAIIFKTYFLKKKKKKKKKG